MLLHHLQGAFAKVIYKLANAISKLPEDGAEAPKCVEAFVIKFNTLIYIYAFVGTDK
jgi:hypothetical protein